MTTIIFDGKFLTTDSAETYESGNGAKCTKTHERVEQTYKHRNKIKLPPADKEIKFKGEKLLAMAGAGSAWVIDFIQSMILDSVPVDKVLKNLKESSKGVSTASSLPSATVMVITAQNAWVISVVRGSVWKITEFPAFMGSGSDEAEVFMKLGASAIQATALTSINDKYTHGPVNFVEIADPNTPLVVKSVSFEFLKERMNQNKSKFGELITSVIGQPTLVPTVEPKHDNT